MAIVLVQILILIAGQFSIPVPVLSQVNGFILLTFVPGTLLLRILRIHHINPVESIAYSVGLSIFTVMFSGMLGNFLFPLIGVLNPLAPINNVSFICFAVLILLLVAYIRDRDFQSTQSHTTGYQIDLPQVLFLISILLLLILADTIVNEYRNSLLLILCLLIIAAVVILALLRKFITPPHYPLLVFTISLCLLYQTTLLSPYLVGSDIYTEYQYYRYAVEANYWDPTVSNPVNSCLSIIMLAPAYSQFLQIDGIWVFKAIYPLLFSFVPVVLYRTFRVQLGEARALLASFFFMIVPTFSLEMTSLCRQQIAELFLVLFIFLLVERRLSALVKLSLLIIFSVSIPVSHYSTSFITLNYLILLPLLLALFRTTIFRKVWSWLTCKTGGIPEVLNQDRSGALSWWVVILPVLVYLIAAFLWYWLVASGINLSVLSSVWTMQSGAAAGATGSGPQDLFVRAALGYDLGASSIQGKIFRILQYITQLFVICGCLRLLFAPKGLKIRIEYVAMSVISAALMAACMILPTFASTLNTTRWYHILLITLAPYFVLGGEAVCNLLQAVWRRLRRINLRTNIYDYNRWSLNLITSAVLIPYFIFTSGIIYEVIRARTMVTVDIPYAISLSSYRLDMAGVFYKQDYLAAAWLSEKSDKGDSIFCDTGSYRSLVLSEAQNPIYIIWGSQPFKHGDKILLNEWNTTSGTVTMETGPGQRDYIDINSINGMSDVLKMGDIVYTNRETWIYVVP